MRDETTSRIVRRAVLVGKWQRFVCRVLGHRLPAWARKYRRNYNNVGRLVAHGYVVCYRCYDDVFLTAGRP